MKKNGFTLIEIIVTIAILSLVIIIVVPVIGNTRDSSKKALLNTKIKNIEAAAVSYGQDNREKFTVSTCELCKKNDEYIPNCYCFSENINVGDLASKGIFEYDENTDIISPYNDNPMNDCTINIYSKYGKIYAKVADGCGL